MANNERSLRFAVHARPDFATYGIVGEETWVEVSQDSVCLWGKEGGAFRAAIPDIDRLRLGHFEGKFGKTFVARLWISGEEYEPLVLVPQDTDTAAYGAAMRLLTAKMVKVGRIGLIETGLSVRSALSFPIAIAVLVLLVALMTIFVWAPEFGCIGGAALLTLFTGFAIAFFVRAFRLDMPRPARSLDTLERHLPRT